MASHRQRYSLYLPVTNKITHRKSSMSKGSDEKLKKDRADTVSRASADPATGKRRATMRSREHDEEAEQIQRAIEESAREAQGGKRSGKRSREESMDEYVINPSTGEQALTHRSSGIKQEHKRQRRVSESIPSVSKNSLEDDTDDDNENTLGSRTKKSKAEAAQSARQAEQREKDKERERARAEAAGRRQERAGRRRQDGKHEPQPYLML